MSKIKPFWINPHNDDCEAAKSLTEKNSHPWILLGKEFSWGTKKEPKKKNGRQRWIHARCKNFKCEARIAIREQDVFKELEYV